MKKETQIANAFMLIARANHYLVGFINIVSLEELQKAEQILIVRSNRVNNKDKELELALDLIAREIKGVKL